MIGRRRRELQRPHYRVRKKIQFADGRIRIPSRTAKPPCTHFDTLASMTSRTEVTSRTSRLRFSVESHQRVTIGILSCAHQVRTSSAFVSPSRYPLKLESPASRAYRRWPS